MPGYQTKQESVDIAGVDDLLIRSLLDRQQYSDPHGEAERQGISSAAWPLFGLLWPSGAQLAARMARRPVCRRETILELGCGLALASLVSHRKGANVTASDCHPLAESFLEENLRLNNLPPMKYLHGHWGTAQAPPHQRRASERQSGTFDLIIGSDLLYERDAAIDLANFIGLHAAPKAEIWIIDPNRGNRPAFNRQMAALGFQMEEEVLNIPATEDTPAYKGRVLIYQWDKQPHCNNTGTEPSRQRSRLPELRSRQSHLQGDRHIGKSGRIKPRCSL